MDTRSDLEKTVQMIVDGMDRTIASRRSGRVVGLRLVENWRGHLAAALDRAKGQKNG